MDKGVVLQTAAVAEEVDIHRGGLASKQESEVRSEGGGGDRARRVPLGLSPQQSSKIQ